MKKDIINYISINFIIDISLVCLLYTLYLFLPYVKIPVFIFWFIYIKFIVSCVYVFNINNYN